MEKLFRDFKPATPGDWKAQLLKELKGEDYETLRWRNENGFVIEPFYTSADLKQAYTPAFYHSDWHIAVNASGADSAQLRAQLLRQLNMGASAIVVKMGEMEPAALLDGIHLDYIHATFFVTPSGAVKLQDYLAKNYELSRLNISLFPEQFNGKEDLAAWAAANHSFASQKGFNVAGFDALPYHNQNCYASYEVAICLSALVEHLDYFSGKAFPEGGFVLRTGVTADYFMQMAKLRALRRLWRLLQKHYNVENDLYVIAETSLTNKSVSDAYNNLLRSTVEAMAAVGGGCNELVVNGFDVLFPSNSALSERMAINQQHILKSESYFDKMADVACGAYYIETLTDAIAGRALEHLKEFEKQGGYFECVRKNIFKTAISEQASARQELFNQGKQLAIGVNKFKNEKESLSLSTSRQSDLQHININNPVLDYELKNFFNHAQVN